MTESQLFLARALAFGLVAAIGMERERLTGDVPNVLSLFGLLAGFGLAAFTSLGHAALALAILALPSLWAFERGYADATVVRLALGFGALLSPIAALVALVLGGIWLRALRIQQDSWRKASRTPPRLTTSPRAIAIAGLGAAAGVGASFFV